MKTWTTIHRVLFVSLAAAAMLLAGCGGDDGDEGDGGNNGAGPSGGGQQITPQNVGTIYSTVFYAINTAVRRGSPGTWPGTRSGTVTVSIGKLVQVPLQNMTYRVIFDNYSDDGSTILDGNITYLSNASGGSESYTYTGRLDISGTYEGRMDFELSGSGQALPNGYVMVNAVRYNVTAGAVAAG